uniref:Beta-galactosidase n=1 Tax=Panagrellus redivivus TaxID=6233 RepID=A0A7E4VRB7_PANRE
MVSVRVFLILLVAVGLAFLAMPVSARRIVPPGVIKTKEIKGSGAEMHGKFIDVNKANVVDLYNWELLMTKNQRFKPSV